MSATANFQQPPPALSELTPVEVEVSVDPAIPIASAKEMNRSEERPPSAQKGSRPATATGKRHSRAAVVPIDGIIYV